MKAVLISINQKWCDLIASGEKTVEVRKTRPKINTPFKCYIYETKTAYNSVSRQNDGLRPHLVPGKVIGEFVCDEVYEIRVNSDDFGRWWHETIDEDCSEDNMCLTFDEVSDYLGYQHGFGWHISNLVIYDEPKELCEFRRSIIPNVRVDCRECQFYDANEGCVECGVYSTIKRPPQSWCYAEPLK